MSEAGTTWTLTQASLTDAEELADLRVLAMRESLERIGRFDPQRSRSRFLETFCAALTRQIEIDGARVGFVVVVPREGVLLLDHLYVLPEHQGRGLGAAVLRRIFSEANRQGLEIRVGALRGSDSNRFYLRHGFTLVEEAEWDNYYVRAPRADSDQEKSGK